MDTLARGSAKDPLPQAAYVEGEQQSQRREEDGSHDGHTQPILAGRCCLSFGGSTARGRQSPEIDGELFCRLKTIVRRFLKAFEDDVVQPRREERVKAHGRGRRLVQDVVSECDGRLLLKRPPTRHHLVKDDTSCIDIDPEVAWLPAQLLRRHVRECSSRLAL